MNYQGIIIAESLGDPAALQDVKIVETTVEEVTQRHQTPWLTRWTLHTVEIPEEKAEEIAQKISKSFDRSHSTNWFADYKNDTHHFIIFPDKIFKVNVIDPTPYKEAKLYGISVGIPEYQLDFDSGK